MQTWQTCPAFIFMWGSLQYEVITISYQTVVNMAYLEFPCFGFQGSNVFQSFLVGHWSTCRGGCNQEPHHQPLALTPFHDSNTMTPWHHDTMTPWHYDTRHYDTMTLWHIDTMTHWHIDTLTQWHNYTMNNHTMMSWQYDTMILITPPYPNTFPLWHYDPPVMAWDRGYICTDIVSL